LRRCSGREVVLDANASKDVFAGAERDGEA
jgi:hypothetical protein